MTPIWWVLCYVLGTIQKLSLSKVTQLVVTDQLKAWTLTRPYGVDQPFLAQGLSKQSVTSEVPSGSPVLGVKVSSSARTRRWRSVGTLALTGVSSPRR